MEKEGQQFTLKIKIFLNFQRKTERRGLRINREGNFDALVAESNAGHYSKMLDRTFIIESGEIKKK